MTEGLLKMSLEPCASYADEVKVELVISFNCKVANINESKLNDLTYKIIITQVNRSLLWTLSGRVCKTLRACHSLFYNMLSAILYLAVP